MIYQVERAVTVRAMDGHRPRNIRMGVATTGSGRTLFGVCLYDSPISTMPKDRDVLTTMCYHVGEGGLDPAELLDRAKETGWFVLHAATPLKVSAIELETAMYRLHLLGTAGEVEEEDVPRGRPLSQAMRQPEPEVVLTTAQRKVLEEMLTRQTDHSVATTLKRARAGVPAWWTNNGQSISQVELDGLAERNLAHIAYEPTDTKHIWCVHTEAAQAALRATTGPTYTIADALQDKHASTVTVDAGDLAELLDASADLDNVPDSWTRLRRVVRPVPGVPEEYLGIPLDDVLRNNWDQPEVEWWRRGVTAATDFPRRGDAVERWLERKWNRADAGPGWCRVLGELLDEYRQRADAGEPLDKKD